MKYGQVQYLKSRKIWKFSDNTFVNKALWCYRDAHKSYFPDTLNMLLLVKSRYNSCISSNTRIKLADLQCIHQSIYRTWNLPTDHFANDGNTKSFLEVEAIGHPTSYDSLWTESTPESICTHRFSFIMVWLSDGWIPFSCCSFTALVLFWPTATLSWPTGTLD